MNINALKVAGKVGQEIWSHAESRQGRSAEAEEIGNVVALLSTPRMSLVNGQNLAVDK
jgi:NAD(P)-dependent dehydrogenase (short-subunit alcohol dehydrogenase family)